MRPRPANRAPVVRAPGRRPTRPAPAWLLGLVSLTVLCSPGAAMAAEGLQLFPHLDWLAIHFVVLLVLIVPVRRWLLEPLVEILKEREARTSGAVARATTLSDQGGDMTARIEERLREARAEAQRARATALTEAEAQERHILEQARSDAARSVAAVRGRIQDELETARASLLRQGDPLAREAASRILGREL